MSLIDGNEKFTSFHGAFLNNLTFVHVPKNVEVKEPIEISSTINSNTFDHLIVLAEDNSKFTLVENSNNKNNSINNEISTANKKINENKNDEIKNNNLNENKPSTVK